MNYKEKKFTIIAIAISLVIIAGFSFLAYYFPSLVEKARYKRPVYKYEFLASEILKEGSKIENKSISFNVTNHIDENTNHNLTLTINSYNSNVEIPAFPASNFIFHAFGATKNDINISFAIDDFSLRDVSYKLYDNLEDETVEMDASLINVNSDKTISIYSLEDIYLVKIEIEYTLND